MFAWLPSASMAAASYFFTDDTSALSFFGDYTAHTRSLLAISLMILTERPSHLRLKPLVYQFADAGLIADEDVNKYNALLERADKRSSSAIVESVILIAVMLIAIFGAMKGVRATRRSKGCSSNTRSFSLSLTNAT